MSPKHTPWRTHGIDVLGEEPDKLLPSPVIHRGERDESSTDLIEADQLANARLISAAPELLKALEEARRFVIAAIEDRVQIPGFDATKHVTVQQIDAALKKARDE